MAKNKSFSYRTYSCDVIIFNCVCCTQSRSLYHGKRCDVDVNLIFYCECVLLFYTLFLSLCLCPYFFFSFFLCVLSVSEFENSLEKNESLGSDMSDSCEQPPSSARGSSISPEYSAVEEKLSPLPKIKKNMFDSDILLQNFDDPFLW